MQFVECLRVFSLSKDGSLDVRMDADRAYGLDSQGRYSHPATKIFQAICIFVNNELNELYSALEIAYLYQYVKPGGICVAISFHSLRQDCKMSLS
ncbi:hypothetical protein ACF0H5_013111 [Mactra antiquata]